MMLYAVSEKVCQLVVSHPHRTYLDMQGHSQPEGRYNVLAPSGPSIAKGAQVFRARAAGSHCTKVNIAPGELTVKIVTMIQDESSSTPDCTSQAASEGPRTLFPAQTQS